MGAGNSWDAALYLVSSRPGNDTSDFTLLRFITRKGGHYSAFGILGLLFYRALVLGEWPRTWSTRLAAIALVGIYAISDETHQMYVGLRTGTWPDVGIDCFGAITAMVLGAWRARRIAYGKEADKSAVQ